MTWALLTATALAFAFLLHAARRRRTLQRVLPSESISPIHGALSRRHSARTRAALDAATAALR